MSKKVLSLALVVVMLMSMFAFSTSAADLTTGQIGLRAESDAKIGAPAGTIVTFKVYYVIPEGADLTNALANTAVAYDNTKFEYVADSCKWGNHYAEGFSAPGSTSVSTTSAISKNIVKKFNANDKAKGWNTGLQVKQTYITLDQGGIWSGTTGYPVTADDFFFSIQFKALTEITADSVIGIPEGAYNSSFFKINDFTNGTYDAVNVDLTEATAAPAAPAEVKVEHFDTMGQMGNWETLTGKFNGGLVGKISNLDLAFDGNECTNLLKIEVALTTATGSSKAEAYQVYEQADGSYLFRAVIKDMDITSEANISAVYTIYVDTDADGEADKTYSSEAVNVNAKGIYEEALANYKAA